MIKRTLLVTALSVVLAFTAQLLIGWGLVLLAEAVYPRQVSSLGMLGSLLIPHPLTGGLFLVPITALVIAAFFVPFFRARRLFGFQPRT